MKDHVWSTWLEANESCQAIKFASTSQERPSSKVFVKLSIWQKEKVFYQIFYPHYKYPHYPRNVRSTFQRENPSKNTKELEIGIPTIIYTFSLGFPLLLPLHLYILEKFLIQTLTTPNLSVEPSFGAFRKYWKEPPIWLNCGIRKASEVLTSYFATCI